MTNDNKAKDCPQMHTFSIPVLDQHYAAFSHRHPFEINAITGFRPAPRGVFVEGIEVREVFSLDSEAIGAVSIDVTGIKRALASRRIPLEMFEAHLNQEWVDYTMQSNGCEEEGIARLTPADLQRPGILMHWTGQHTTLVDGAHRLVRRWREGLTTFQFAYVPLTRETMAYVARPGDEAKFYDKTGERR